LGDFWQKLAIKIHHVQKSLQMTDHVWPRKFKHDLQTVLKRGDAGGAEVVAKKVELWHGKLAPVQVDGEPIVYQDPEDSPQVFHMLVQVPARHRAII
jgi:hypothetical protein